MKNENRSKSGRKWPSVVAGVLLGIRILYLAYIILVRVGLKEPSGLEGFAWGLAMLVLSAFAVSGIFAGIVLLLSTFLKESSVEEDGKVSRKKGLSTVRKVAFISAACAVFLYWLSWIIALFSGGVGQSSFIFLAFSCLASVVSVVMMIIFCVMKKCKKRENENTIPQSSEDAGVESSDLE